MASCRVCRGELREFLDLGQQPVSDAFLEPDELDNEFFFHLQVAICGSCTMVQLVEEVPRERMFHNAYPYLSSGSAGMREHFERTARQFLATELTGPDPFIVELGCNDGVMLRTIGEADVKHLGVEPSGGVASLARAQGLRVRTAFFEESTAAEILDDEQAADVIYGANTICHIPYLGSVLRGVDTLLKPGGVFVFEDPCFGDIVAQTSFDQIYDEHFYFFTATSVRALAHRFGFELVGVERLPVHGGEIRYSLARKGERTPAPAVAELLSEEESRALGEVATCRAFADDVQHIREDLVDMVRDLRDRGRTVVGYGATAKSATVTNFCGIGPDLVPFICDSTPAKQGKLAPGSHIPVRPPEAFAESRPDYALLFAWNHAGEITAKERDFRDGGGRWIKYVPQVYVD
ncbi:class I SAM-dependent methyltransferase [Amycolatopsis rubida]|uniref:Methylation protein EvaC n=1 Tax=Amycolatopsis rubida TaxID=112413 RepID=A0A1I5TN29_9PSEU|nr:class I SAM-dependent methyltransferase [Amycolatopsis rubida]SFP83736.1 methylation protein EvaC [Amycolatopsis rubida]